MRPGDLVVTYRILCGYCEAQHVQTMTQRPGDYPLRPSLGPAWRYLDNIAVCDKHAITVDGAKA